ncbi:hypothetical protein HPP92_019435 [Vanilla planifolia]|uniref:YDG domain-containing protein n=1 Tax=Vanilla planifolia TaxID=51239 RepID=A0A835Q3B1_VANPL|nr:hypothetical protein HPP92_019435 [Vanilla planifolia]
MNVIGGKIYIYDGLYKICESWVDKAKSGFNIFKYKMFKEPGQLEGIAVWKCTEKWKENPSSRGHQKLDELVIVGRQMCNILTAEMLQGNHSRWLHDFWKGTQALLL